MPFKKRGAYYHPQVFSFGLVGIKRLDLNRKLQKASQFSSQVARTRDARRCRWSGLVWASVAILQIRISHLGFTTVGHRRNPSSRPAWFTDLANMRYTCRFSAVKRPENRGHLPSALVDWISRCIFHYTSIYGLLYSIIVVNTILHSSRDWSQNHGYLKSGTVLAAHLPFSIAMLVYQKVFTHQISTINNQKHP